MRPKFEQTVTSVCESHPNSAQLIEAFKLVDALKINECRKVVDEINALQKNLKTIFNYSNQDRENMAALLGTRAPSFERDALENENVAVLKELIRIAREELDQALCLKWAEKSKVDTYDLNIRQMQKLLQAYQNRIGELAGEVEQLRVREKTR